MVPSLLAVSAIVPSLLLVAWFRGRDLNPEPSRAIWATFFWGVASTAGVLLVALPLGIFSDLFRTPLERGLWDAFATAALPEETAKLAVVLLFAARRPAFDEPMDGMVYGAVAGLGFAALENVLYVLDGGFGLAIVRALTCVPAHAAWGAILGYTVGRVRFSGAPKLTLAGGWLWAVALHGIYDAPLMTLGRAHGAPPILVLGMLGVSLGAVVASWILVLHWQRRLRREQHPAAPPLPQVPSDDPAQAQSSAAPQAPPATPPQGTQTVGLALVLGGGLLASVGGTVVLAGLLALLVSTQATELLLFALGLGALALPPLLLGLALFTAGLRRLGRARPRAARA